MTRLFVETQLRIDDRDARNRPCMVGSSGRSRKRTRTRRFSSDTRSGSRGARNRLGHFAKAKAATDVSALSRGRQEMKAEDLRRGRAKVDVAANTKGQGLRRRGIRRHHFNGGPGGHGSERLPSCGRARLAQAPSLPGSKGHAHAGHMGSNRVTIRNLNVVADAEKNVLIVRRQRTGAERRTGGSEEGCERVARE